jgi:hypothetical protein
VTASFVRGRYRRDSYLNSSDLITTGTTFVSSMTLPMST